MIVSAGALAAAGIGYRSGRGDSAVRATDDPGLVHVHGLGVNPADGLLYAASHSGLFRVDEKGRADRIANRSRPLLQTR